MPTLDGCGEMSLLFCLSFEELVVDLLFLCFPGTCTVEDELYQTGGETWLVLWTGQ